VENELLRFICIEAKVVEGGPIGDVNHSEETVDLADAGIRR